MPTTSSGITTIRTTFYSTSSTQTTPKGVRKQVHNVSNTTYTVKIVEPKHAENPNHLIDFNNENIENNKHAFTKERARVGWAISEKNHVVTSPTSNINNETLTVG